MTDVPICLLPGTDLKDLRKLASRLQRGVRDADATALSLVVEHHDAALVATDELREAFPLTAAQLVVARAYGFTSWARLKAYLTAASAHRSDPTPVAAQQDTAADEFCRLACLTWTADDDPAHWANARKLLERSPGVVDETVWAAATAADPDAVRRHLDADPALAVARGGPHGWTPLLHLTYSRLDPRVPATAVIDTARLLLDTGADPDAGFLWQGLVPPFTALTGAFGEGEQGPVRQPRHPHSLALARLLLEAGADPNDGQTLYNRMFRPDDDHLLLLLEFGLGRGDGGPWRQRFGDALATPGDLMREQVERAVEYGYPDRVRLLASHGVDVRTPTADGSTLAEQAARRGDTDVLDTLVAAGAVPPLLDDVDQLVAAVHAGSSGRVDELLAAAPDLADQARRRSPDLVLSVRTPGAVPLLARLGFDLDARPDGRTALHEAALADDLPLVRALVEAGADPGAQDAEHHSSPLGWAQHVGAATVVAYLAERAPGQG